MTTSLETLIQEAVRDICSVSVAAAPKSAVRRILDEFATKVFSAGEESVLKEILLDFHKNQLEGKGFDFFFVLSTKFDDLKARTNK